MVGFEEGEEVGPSEVPIPEDNGPNSHGKNGEDSQEGLLLQTVLALGGRQVIPIIGHLQQR